MKEVLRVLLVEDNPGDADLIREMLPERGPVSFTILRASRLSEALDVLRTRDVDVVLLDLGLPDSTGLDTLRVLQPAAPNIPIIVLTGNADDEQAVAAIGEGAQDYLVKGRESAGVLMRHLRFAVQRSELEQALRQSEASLQAALRAASMAAWDWNLRTGTFHANDRWAEILGYAQGEVIPSPEIWQKHVHPDHLPHGLAAWRAFLEGGSDTYEEEYPVLTTSGETRQVLATGLICERDGTGAGSHIIGTVQDITERNRSEEALLASKKILEGIINAIPVRVFWKDKDLVYLGCNAVFARDAGFTDPKDIIGKDDFQMGWRDQAELYRADDRTVIENGSSKYLVEEPQTTPEGKTITLLTSKIPLRDSKGEIIGLLGTYMDITERKKAEDALRESEERLRFTLSAVRSVAYDLDLESGALTETGPVAELFGQPDGFRHPDTASLLASIHPEDRAMVKDRLAAAERGESSYHVEYRLIPQCGETRWIMASGDLLRDGTGKPLRHVGIAQNITKRKRAEEDLKAQAAHLEQLNEELARFNRLAVGRESRMIELKRQMNEMAAKHGEPPPFPLDFLKDEEAKPRG